MFTSMLLTHRTRKTITCNNRRCLKGNARAFQFYGYEHVCQYATAPVLPLYMIMKAATSRFPPPPWSHLTLDDTPNRSVAGRKAENTVLALLLAAAFRNVIIRLYPSIPPWMMIPHLKKVIGLVVLII